MNIFGTQVSFFFAWYDLWVGAYYDRKGRALYLCLLPCLGLKLEFGRKKGRLPEFEDLVGAPEGKTPEELEQMGWVRSWDPSEETLKKIKLLEIKTEYKVPEQVSGDLRLEDVRVFPEVLTRMLDRETKAFFAANENPAYSSCGRMGAGYRAPQPLPPEQKKAVEAQLAGYLELDQEVEKVLEALSEVCRASEKEFIKREVLECGLGKAMLGPQPMTAEDARTRQLQEKLQKDMERLYKENTETTQCPQGPKEE